jgi:hypothetical protein
MQWRCWQRKLCAVWTLTIISATGSALKSSMVRQQSVVWANMHTHTSSFFLGHYDLHHYFTVVGKHTFLSDALLVANTIIILTKPE